MPQGSITACSECSLIAAMRYVWDTKRRSLDFGRQARGSVSSSEADHRAWSTSGCSRAHSRYGRRRGSDGVSPGDTELGYRPPGHAAVASGAVYPGVLESWGFAEPAGQELAGAEGHRGDDDRELAGPPAARAWRMRSAPPIRCTCLPSAAALARSIAAARLAAKTKPPPGGCSAGRWVTTNNGMPHGFLQPVPGRPTPRPTRSTARKWIFGELLATSLGAVSPAPVRPAVRAAAWLVTAQRSQRGIRRKA